MSVSETQQRPLVGIVLVLCAVLLFACMDATGKYLFQVRGYSVPLVQAARYATNLVLVVALFGRQERNGLWQTRRPALVWVRAASLALGTYTASYALKAMPVAETTAIVYLGPFGVLLLAWPLMGERVRWFGWAATVIAFAGLMVIARPGTGLSTAGILWALACASTTVSYHSLSRYLAGTETTARLLFYAALCGTIFFCVQLPGNFGRLPDSVFDAALFIVLGCLGMLGHLLFTAAYRQAPLALLTPVNYMQIVWAVALGWLVFHHVPDIITFIGIALVAASGAGNAILSHRSHTAAAAVEPEEV